MREIKIKVWDKDREHWVSDRFEKDKITFNIFDLVIDKWLLFKETSTFPQYESIPQRKNIIIVQYIDLKDRHGKEIYEGDVTEIVAFDGKINRFVIRYGIARRIMDSGWKVDIPSFYFDLISGNFKAFPIVDNYMGIHDLEIMEIIGNIYENPELVEKNEWRNIITKTDS